MPSAYATSEPAPGAAARPDRNAVVLGPVDEVGDDQEVAGEAHLHDGRGFEVEPLGIFGTPRSRVAGSRIQRGEPALEPGRGFVPQMVVQRDAVRRWKIRQKVLAHGIVRLQRLAISTELANADGTSAKAAAISACDLKYWSGVKRRPARVGEDVAFGDTDSRFVRTEVVAPQELHRVGGDDGQRELTRKSHGRRDQRIVVGVARALHLEIIAVRK